MRRIRVFESEVKNGDEQEIKEEVGKGTLSPEVGLAETTGPKAPEVVAPGERAEGLCVSVQEL